MGYHILCGDIYPQCIRAELIWSLPPYTASGLNLPVFIFDNRENRNAFAYYLRVMKNN